MKPARRNMKQKVCQVSSILGLKTTPGVFHSNDECFVFVGQMRLWNPDEPSTPRGSNAPPSTSLEERLQEACSELMISWDGYASHVELLVLSEHLGLKVRPKHFVEIDPCILKNIFFQLNLDLLQSLSGKGIMSVQEFVSRVLNCNKTQTPSASTPYRQLKRHHSTQVRWCTIFFCSVLTCN